MGRPSRKKRRAADRGVAGDKASEAFHVPVDGKVSEDQFSRKAGDGKYLPLLASSAALITFLVYLQSLRNDFIKYWDDRPYVYANPHIHTFNWDFIRWAFSDFYEANWHPLTWISHALDYAVWGLNPFGHHLTNSILHSVNTALVVLITVWLIDLHGERTVPKETVSWQKGRGILIAGVAAGLLFGLHPIHVESVAMVAERKDLLCALFFLLSVMAYMKYAGAVSYDGGPLLPYRDRRYLLSAGFFLLALLSKPMAVSLPAVLLILDWYPLRRIQSLKSLRAALIEKVPFILLSLLSCLLTIRAQRAGGAMGLMEVVPLSTRVLVAFKSLVSYLWKTIMPIHLVPYYPYPKDVSLLSPEYLLAIVLVLGITTACSILVKNKRILLAAWCYYLITVLPVLGIVQVGEQSMADRYMYLPSLSLFFIAGLTMAWGWSVAAAMGRRKAFFQSFWILLAVFLFTSITSLTLGQIKIWRDTFAFWNYVIEMEPSSVALAYNNRGNALYDSGQLDKAFDDFDKAIALNPSYPAAYNNRGLAFKRQGRFDKALADYDKAIALNPNYFEAYNNRGVVFKLLGQPDKALADFSQAIALHQSYSIYYLRGSTFEEKGQFDKAMQDYHEAIALNPSYVEARVRLGVLYGKSGSLDKAIDQFDKAIEINPNYTLAYDNRGFAYSLTGQRSKALEDFAKAIEIDNRDTSAYINRGNVYLKMGDRESAVSDFQRACDLGYKAGCNVLQTLKR